MSITHAVGIDLGTTYSCIAYLNEHGEPVTLANQEGELATPSVVLFDRDGTVVGTEALRNAIVQPKRVVQNSKRHIGKPNYGWIIDGKTYSPTDIATLILKKMLSAAQDQIGRIDRAVITVPALFGDVQRHATVEAGHRAGLKQVDIINEPVAAALCYVLGSAGMWFTELADEQRILVYDLGGGTFDLSLVRYRKNEVSVIASSGDLSLGGIDWNGALAKKICQQFSRQFKTDPQSDPASLQALALEVEQTKRSLSARPRAALTCQHGGHRKTYKVDLEQFEKMTKPFVDHTSDIVRRMLKDNKMGWAHVDVVLMTGGASRMPMIQKMLRSLSGRTLNTSLSPDMSIAHGATYYAGMLLTNSKFAKSLLSAKARDRLASVKQQSVNARALGVIVRDPRTNLRFPHYVIPANTLLPASVTQEYGTVIPNQSEVKLQIVESGETSEATPILLGTCVIDDLPANLPEGSRIAVTVRYDAAAKVHVSAREVKSGKQTTTEIVRRENLIPQMTSDQDEGGDVALLEADRQKPKWIADRSPQPAAENSSRSVSPQNADTQKPRRKRRSKPKRAQSMLEDADQPVQLCNKCEEPLDARGRCPTCGPSKQKVRGKRSKASSNSDGKARTPVAKSQASAPNRSAEESPANEIETRIDFPILDDRAPDGADS